MLSSRLHAAVPLSSARQHVARNPGRLLGIIRASDNQSPDDSVLSWSSSESYTVADTAAADVSRAADTPHQRQSQPRQGHRKGPQSQSGRADVATSSQPPHSSQRSTARRQHHTGKQRFRDANDTPGSPSRAPKAGPAASHSPKPHSSSTGRRTAPAAAAGSAAPDPYWEAQQRVRAVLAAADPNDPAAAAEQLPGTVNDLTIALQLLATAPRPASLAAHRQYDAAVQQLAAAVLHKYKQLLLHLLPPPSHTARPQPAASNTQRQHQPTAGQPQEQQQEHQQAPGSSQGQQQQQQQQQGPDSPQGQHEQQQQLADALASLPATKLAATAFSLGVLRLYDRQLVGALEDASLLLLHRNAFKANQLGQLVQGFVYLDHPLNPEWHAGFLAATRRHLGSMQGPQLASLAAWLASYGLCGIPTSGSGSSSSRGLQGSSTGIISLPGEGRVGPLRPAGLVTSPATADAAAAGPSTPAVQADPGWAHAYLAAVGRQAGALKPLQLVQVLRTAAMLWQQLQAGAVMSAGRGAQQLLQQGQQGSRLQPAIRLGNTPGQTQADLGVVAVSKQQQQSSTHQPQSAAAGGGSSGNAHSRGFHEDLPQRQPQQQQRRQHDSGDRSKGGSSSGEGNSWAASLVAAVQQQLPELTMAHLAAVLPALLALTQQPWPPQLLAPILMQIKVQLPGCAGRDLVAVAQAAALLAGPDVLAAEQAWCDGVLVQLHAQLPTLSPAELAGTINAVALLRVRPYKAWVYALCQRLRVDARVMDAQQTLVVLEGLAAVGIQLDPEVLHAFVLQIERFMGSWNGSELGRVAQALRSMYPKVLPGRTVQQLVGELQRRQQFLALQVQQQRTVSMFGSY